MQFDIDFVTAPQCWCNVVSYCNMANEDQRRPQLLLQICYRTSIMWIINTFTETCCENNKVIGILCPLLCSLSWQITIFFESCVFANNKMYWIIFVFFLCLNFNIVVVFVSFFFCRGFGFVTFTDAASVDKVLAQQHHELDSKTVSSFCLHLYVFICCFVFTVFCPVTIVWLFTARSLVGEHLLG